MPWARLDDDFYDHPKVIRAGLKAVGLFVVSLSYAARHLTDGRIPAEFVGKQRRLAERLVQVGLFERDGPSYRIHDYLDYNPSASHVRGERRAARVRMNRLRADHEIRPNISGSSPSPSRPVPIPSRKDGDITRSLAPTPSPDGPLVTPEEARAQIRQLIVKTAQDKAMP